MLLDVMLQTEWNFKTNGFFSTYGCNRRFHEFWLSILPATGCFDIHKFPMVLNNGYIYCLTLTIKKIYHIGHDFSWQKPNKKYLVAHQL